MSQVPCVSGDSGRGDPSPSSSLPPEERRSEIPSVIDQILFLKRIEAFVFAARKRFIMFYISQNVLNAKGEQTEENTMTDDSCDKQNFRIPESYQHTEKLLGLLFNSLKV